MRWMLMHAGVKLGLALYGFHRTQRLPVLPVCPVSGPLPSLSIIVPARNEAENLRRLLPSLRQLRYPGPLEILVVDDQSRDDTARVAAAFGIPVLFIRELPQGWLGKPYAAHQGALATRGEWLLFTDADTWHAPDSAASAVAWALTYEADGLTLFPAFDFNSALEAAALAAAFAGLFAALRASHGIVNGQYLLIRREVYERIGGFAAVRDQMLEDLALGVRLHASGYRVPMLDGQHALRVRMYSGLRHMLDGMSRLSAGTLVWPGLRPWIAALLIAWLATPFSIPRLGIRDRGWTALISWATSGLSLLPWTWRMGRPEAALLAPLGAAIVAVAGLRGLFQRWIGTGIHWKERRVR